MKNLTKFIFFCVLFSSLLISDILAQEFETGGIAVRVSSYGRIRAYAPALDNVLQVERLTALVGSGANAVFDYWNDWDTELTPYLVNSPQLSDFEIYGEYNNAYSFAPPNILAKNSVYGWTNGKFLIVKYTLINRESSDLNAVVGLEYIQAIDNAYGFETVQYLFDSDVINTFRSTSTNVGLKLLSGNFSSVTSIDWYDGYNNLDSDLWGWITYGSIDTTYTTTSADGVVTLPAQSSALLSAGDSVTIFLGISVGANETEMLANMDSAVTKYNEMVLTAIDELQPITPAIFNLEQNYPNPFNPSTKIKFSIDKKDKVSLVVFDMLGREVITLVNGELDAGEHDYEFNAQNLTSGVYFYTLASGGKSITHKMILLK